MLLVLFMVINQVDKFYFINFINSENFRLTPFSDETTKTNTSMNYLELPSFHLAPVEWFSVYFINKV